MGNIAIIGLSGRFPGAKNLTEFWNNLCQGKETTHFFTEDELRKAGISQEVLSAPDYVKAAPILQEIDQFDADFFSFSRREAEFLDPQQRLLLECAWEVLESAGYATDSVSQSIGVFAGSGGSVTSYLLDCLAANPEIRGTTGGFQHLGNDKDFLATRISYKLNLRGPSVAVQSACSTSLVAVHLAAQSILNGECDMALAGGVNIRVPHISGYLRQEGDIYSIDGHCRTFDADATGIVFGSGLGLVLLKPLEDAIRDRDEIFAVIKGSSINNDGGAKVSYTASSATGQVRCMVESLSVADVNPETIQFVEAHGTGTAMGDPVEISALTQAFRKWTKQTGYCAIGSVKTNLGHLDAAAGITSLIKTVLSLYHGKMVPIVNFKTPNPKINFKNTPFFVNTELRDWPRGSTPRRAAVNGLGIGGTNAFLVLEEAPTLETRVSDKGPSGKELLERPSHILALSAKSPVALKSLTQRYNELVGSEQPVSLPDLCFSAAQYRKFFDHRLAVIASSKEDLSQKLKQLVDSESGITGALEGVVSPDGVRLAVLFTGQGSQYVGMGKQLYETQPVFKKHLDQCAEILRKYLEKPLLEVMFKDEALLNQTRYTQPALFALEYSLYQLWSTWGVKPTAVMGHSVGELVAACVAGVFTLEDGLKLITARAGLMDKLPGKGSMGSIQANEQRVRQVVEPYLKEISIAAINGPESTVISGDQAIVRKVLGEFEGQGVKVKELTVSHGFHSPQMEGMLKDFEKVAGEIQYSNPKIKLISNVTGKVVAGDELGSAQYWSKHVREAVRFADGVNTLSTEGYRTYLEVGPGTTLSGMGQLCVAGSEEYRWYPTLKKDRTDWEQILETLGKLYVQGAKVDWKGFEEGYPTRQKVQLPTYPFQRQRFWVDFHETPRSLNISPQDIEAYRWAIMPENLKDPLAIEILKIIESKLPESNNAI